MDSALLAHTAVQTHYKAFIFYILHVNHLFSMF